MLPFSYRRRAVFQGKSLFIQLELRFVVLRVDHDEDFAEGYLEIDQAGIVVAELVFQGNPGDELRFGSADAVQALGKP